MQITNAHGHTLRSENKTQHLSHALVIENHNLNHNRKSNGKSPKSENRAATTATRQRHDADDVYERTKMPRSSPGT